MGYSYTRSLNLEVTVRKLKSDSPLPMLSAQIFSSAGTMGAVSVPDPKKPCSQMLHLCVCHCGSGCLYGGCAMAP